MGFEPGRLRFAYSTLPRLIDEAGRDEVGGILAIPVADTLKRADEEHRIVATEPRDGLWRAQTPQMFRHRILVRALREAEHVPHQAGAGGGPGFKTQTGAGSTRKPKNNPSFPPQKPE